MGQTGSEGEMSFFEHLEELRGHIVRSLMAVLLCAVAAFIWRKFLFDSVLLAPQQPEFITNRLFCRLGGLVHADALCINSVPVDIQNIALAGQFSAALMVSFFSGIVIAFPYIIYEIWRFIRPALYEQERQQARGAVWIISSLFFAGVCFGYFLIAPLSSHFFIQFSNSEQIRNLPTLQSYLSMISSVTLGSGLLFELPVFVYFLSKIGVLTPDFLVRYRKHAIVILLTLSAIITPPDVFSQIVVVMPLVLLYECSIKWSRSVTKNRLNNKQVQHDSQG